MTCFHSDFSKKGRHLTNFAFFCARALFTSACINQNPNERVVWGAGAVCIFVHVVWNALLADFANYDIVVTRPAVPCSLVHVRLYCIKTEAGLKSLENADHITSVELFYQPLLKYVVFNSFFSPPNYLGKIFRTKKPFILPSYVAASASFLLPWSPSFTESAEQMVITISGYCFPF